MKSRILIGLAAVLLMLASLGWAGEPAPVPAYLPVAGMVTLVDLGAGSCKPCKLMTPLLEELREQYQGRAAVVFVDVRYDRPAIERYGLRAIPTQIFFDRNGKEVYRHLGFLDKQSMAMTLDKLLAAP